MVEQPELERREEPRAQHHHDDELGVGVRLQRPEEPVAARDHRGVQEPDAGRHEQLVGEQARAEDAELDVGVANFHVPGGTLEVRYDDAGDVASWEDPLAGLVREKRGVMARAGALVYAVVGSTPSPPRLRNIFLV